MFEFIGARIDDPCLDKAHREIVYTLSGSHPFAMHDDAIHSLSIVPAQLDAPGIWMNVVLINESIMVFDGPSYKDLLERMRACVE